MTQITNTWITLAGTQNGATVERKFAGLHTEVDENNNVEFCYSIYWERELYPNGTTSKITKKFYEVKDLDGLPILTGFIQAFAQVAIVNSARETLENEGILPIGIPTGYVLKSETFA